MTARTRSPSPTPAVAGQSLASESPQRAAPAPPIVSATSKSVSSRPSRAASIVPLRRSRSAARLDKLDDKADDPDSHKAKKRRLTPKTPIPTAESDDAETDAENTFISASDDDSQPRIRVPAPFAADWSDTDWADSETWDPPRPLPRPSRPQPAFMRALAARIAYRPQPLPLPLPSKHCPARTKASRAARDVIVAVRRRSDARAKRRARKLTLPYDGPWWMPGLETVGEVDEGVAGVNRIVGRGMVVE